MNLRRCFAPRQLLFLLAAGLITTGDRPALSQETIALNNGPAQQVRVLGTTPTGVKVQMGAGVVLVEPFASVTQLTMDPPQQFTAAQAAYESGDLQTAFKYAATVVQNYRGLPTDWAQQAMLTLGDIYVSLNQLPQAEAEYRDYLTAYRKADSPDVQVGLARIDISKKDYAAANIKVARIIEQGLKQQNPSPTAAALLGRALYVSGQIKEQAGDLPGALEDYLRTAAIFPEDRVAAANAQERADAIRKEHGTTVP